MEWFLWALAVAVLGLGAVVASGRWGFLPGTVRDAPLPVLPDGPLTADDLRGLEFEVVTRGYSMAQVDEVPFLRFKSDCICARRLLKN